MKKILICWFALAAVWAYCDEVSPDEAREAVVGWATLGDALQGEFEPQISGVATCEGEDGLGKFHVVSFADGGFAVTSGDTETTPILAYSDDGVFEASDDNPLWVMLRKDTALRARQAGRSSNPAANLVYAANPAPASSAAADAWARLREAGAAEAAKAGEPAMQYAAAPTKKKTADISEIRVAPLCKTLWNQLNVNGIPCYNYYTPSNYYCGCVATAMAQIMKHYEWPKTAVEVGSSHFYRGTVRKTIKGGADNIITNWYMGKITEDQQTYENYTLPDVFTGPEFGGPYDWDEMPDTPNASMTDTQRRAIGLLCRDCGISVSMAYAADGSGSSVWRVRSRLTDQFGYANSEIIDEPSADEAVQTFISNFDAGFPCEVSIPGHAIVADGYGYSDARIYIHLNYGWGVHSATAWYTPPLDGETGSDWKTVDEVVYNIYTPEQCAEANRTIVSGRVLDEDGFPVSGLAVTAANTATTAAFAAETDANGIYALLLPPNATYLISASRDGKSATTVRSVGQNVSYKLKETVYYILVANTGKQNMANISGVDLMLTDDGEEDAWIRENTGTGYSVQDRVRWTGVWSDAIAYGADGKALLIGENTFTPSEESDGEIVSIDVKATLNVARNFGDADADAQAAVRLGENGSLQVWTAGAWRDVSAPGVTAVDGGEYVFRFDFHYAQGTYSVAVVRGARSDYLRDSAGLTAFALAAEKTAVSGITFAGETRFTSLYGQCADEGFAPGNDVEFSGGGTVALDAPKAAYLNSFGSYSSIAAKAASLDEDAFARAYLCNLDLSKETANAELILYGMRINDDDAEIDVRLERTNPVMDGEAAAPINGVLKLRAADTVEDLSNPAAETFAEVSLRDDDFSNGDTATVTVAIEGNTKFYKAAIEEK